MICGIPHVAQSCVRALLCPLPQSLFRRRAAKAKVGGLRKAAVDEWVRVKDEGSGEYYYFNKLTGACTWTMPVTGKFNSDADLPDDIRARLVKAKLQVSAWRYVSNRPRARVSTCIRARGHMHIRMRHAPAACEDDTRDEGDAEEGAGVMQMNWCSFVRVFVCWFVVGCLRGRSRVRGSRARAPTV